MPLRPKHCLIFIFHQIIAYWECCWCYCWKLHRLLSIKFITVRSGFLCIFASSATVIFIFEVSTFKKDFYKISNFWISFPIFAYIKYSSGKWIKIIAQKILKKKAVSVCLWFFAKSLKFWHVCYILLCVPFVSHDWHWL